MLTKVFDRILPMHPVTGDYDNMPRAEYEALMADIKRHGLRSPILVWRDQVVDGRHRYNACHELEIVPSYKNIDHLTEKEMRDYVDSFNQKRRSRTVPLSNEEKRKRVEAELKADPARSDHEIGKIA